MKTPKFKIGDFVVYNIGDPIWKRYNGTKGIVVGVEKSTATLQTYNYTVKWISVVVNKKINQGYSAWGCGSEWESGWREDALIKWSGK